MKVETRKSSIQVVMMRLLGELAAKAGMADLPLFLSVQTNMRWVLRLAHLMSSTLTQAGLAVR